MKMQIGSNSMKYSIQQNEKHKQDPGDRNLNAGAIFPRLGSVNWRLRDKSIDTRF